jgi:hypothetical protein
VTRWRWVAISPEINLTLTLDSDDPELILRVEFSAAENGILLHRLDDEGDAGVREPAGAPLDNPGDAIAQDYAESAE